MFSKCFVKVFCQVFVKFLSKSFQGVSWCFQVFPDVASVSTLGKSCPHICWVSSHMFPMFFVFRKFLNLFKLLRIFLCGKTDFRFEKIQKMKF